MYDFNSESYARELEKSWKWEKLVLANFSDVEIDEIGYDECVNILYERMCDDFLNSL